MVLVVEVVIVVVVVYSIPLIAEWEVCTASYRPSFFPSFYGLSVKHAGNENKEGKNEDP